MKNQQQYKEDLKEIKDIMNRSSRFISLSGWAGVSAGFFALIGAWLAYQVLHHANYWSYETVALSNDELVSLIGLAFGVLIAAISAGIFFTTRKAKKQNLPLWDKQTKLLLINLFIPLATGGVLCVLMLLKGFVGFMAPFTLIFYGLALVNASKYTFKEIRSLGISQIILGLCSTYFIGYGLWFWAIGFGVLHIIYGIIMQVKYEA